MENREPSYTAGGDANWCNHHGKQQGVSLKTKNRGILYDPEIPFLGIYSPNMKTLNLKRCVHPTVHHSTAYNCQDTEAR